MNPEVTIIPITAAEIAAVAAALLLLPAALILRIFLLQPNNPILRDEPDWSIPSLEAPSGGGSLFHRWHPAAKIAALLISALLIASLHTLAWSLAALGGTSLALLVARLPWQRTRRRLTAMAGFLALFPLIMPFTSPVRPGDTVLLLADFAAWPFRLQGLVLALTVVAKAVSVALLMEPMLATAPLNRTLRGFAGLGLPPALIQMLLLSHRYLFVFQEELGRMLRAARVRGFSPATDLATLRTVGNCLGMLFIRAFERTERVHEAMCCRGYTGLLPAGPPVPITSADRIKAVCAVGLALALFLFDRLAPVAWPC